MDFSSPERGKRPVDVHERLTPKQIRWTYEMEKLFLELLLQQERLGNRVGGTFTPHAYRNILQELQAIYGTGLQKKHLKNKIRTLKQQYSEFKDAFRGMSGFSWNCHTKKFEAETAVWESLIQDNPRAACIRGKSCLHWDNLNMLWSSSRATGNEAATATECCRNLDDQFNAMPFNDPLQDSNAPNFSQNINLEDGSPNVVGATSAIRMPFTSTSLPSTGRTSSKNKRKASDSDLEVDMVQKKISISLSEVSRAIVSSAEILASKVTRPHPNSADLFLALHSLNLDETFLLDAYEYLGKNDAEAELFLGTLPGYRDAILRRIMAKRS